MILNSVEQQATFRSVVRNIALLSSKRSLLRQAQESTVQTHLATLGKGSLTLKDNKRLLEASDLGLALCLTGLVSLGLGNAPILDLCIVLIDSIELRLSGLQVRRHLGNVFVEPNKLLRLILHVLIFEGAC